MDIVELATAAAAIASKVGVWERCCLDVGRVPMMIVATDATNTAQPSATAAAVAATGTKHAERGLDMVWRRQHDDATIMMLIKR